MPWTSSSTIFLSQCSSVGICSSTGQITQVQHKYHYTVVKDISRCACCFPPLLVSLCRRLVTLLSCHSSSRWGESALQLKFFASSSMEQMLADKPLLQMISSMTQVSMAWSLPLAWQTCTGRHWTHVSSYGRGPSCSFFWQSTAICTVSEGRERQRCQ